MMYLPSLFGEDLVDDFMDPVESSFFSRPFFTGMGNKSFLRTDVTEKDGNYDLAVDMPGVKKDDIAVELKDGYLNISATANNNKEDKDDKGNVIRQERFSGKVARSFYVGDDVTEKDVHAKFEDGVLHLTLPKKDEKKAVEDKKLIAIE